MHGLHTADQVRAAEAAMMRTVGDGVLMRRAAAGLAHHVRAFLGATYGRRVVLLVGAGDNGGDALWAGAELRRRGAHVTAVLLAPDRAHPAGLAALRAARGRVLALHAPPVSDPGPAAAGALDTARALIAVADVVVDGIVGISGRGALRDPAPELVAAADGAGVPIVACDLPSGVDCDTGATDGPHVRAALTVTFGTRKPVHALAAPLCGPVRLVDFGLGPYLEGTEPHAWVLSDGDVGARWPVPGPDDDKYSQGVVGIAAGSATYPGAAVLAAGAAALATSGMVRFAGSAADEVRRHWPEIVATGDITDAGRTQAWAVGPGLGTGGQGLAVLEEALGREVPLCLDADAITLLAQHAHLRDRIHGEPVVLTPHAGGVRPDRGRGRGRPDRRRPPRRRRPRGDGAAEGERDRRRRTGRTGARRPRRGLLGRDRGLRRRAHRHDRRVARRRARPVVGGGLRDAGARPRRDGGRPRARPAAGPGSGVGDAGGDPGRAAGGAGSRSPVLKRHTGGPAPGAGC